jgi:hypothetical protein
MSRRVLARSSQGDVTTLACNGRDLNGTHGGSNRDRFEAEIDIVLSPSKKWQPRKTAYCQPNSKTVHKRALGK